MIDMMFTNLIASINIDKRNVIVILAYNHKVLKKKHFKQLQETKTINIFLKSRQSIF